MTKFNEINVLDKFVSASHIANVYDKKIGSMKSRNSKTGQKEDTFLFSFSFDNTRFMFDGSNSMCAAEFLLGVKNALSKSFFGTHNLYTVDMDVLLENSFIWQEIKLLQEMVNALIVQEPKIESNIDRQEKSR